MCSYLTTQMIFDFFYLVLTSGVIRIFLNSIFGQAYYAKLRIYHIYGVEFE